MFKTIMIITITLCALVTFIGNHYRLAGNYENEGKIAVRLVLK
jgi:hypothetical protein